MVVREVARENSSQVRFVEYDDVVKTIAADAADQAFDVRIGLRRLLHPMVPIRRNFFRSPIPSIHLTDVSLH